MTIKLKAIAFDPATEKPLPCPHGREPMGGQDGWKHCPHCLGINSLEEVEDPIAKKKTGHQFKDKDGNNISIG